MDSNRGQNLLQEESTHTSSSSKPVTYEYYENNTNNGSNKTLDNKNYVNESCYSSSVMGCNTQVIAMYKEQENVSYKSKIDTPRKSSDKKCKEFLSTMVIVSPKSLLSGFGKNDNKTGSAGIVKNKNLKSLSFKSKKPVLKYFICEEKVDSDKEDTHNSLLAYKEVAHTKHPVPLCTTSLYMSNKRIGSPNFNVNQTGLYSKLTMLKRRCHVQNHEYVSEPECHTNLNSKHNYGTGESKQMDKSVIYTNKSQSPKLRQRKSLDRDTRIQYQLAEKLMPVSVSDDLIFHRKIEVKTHTSEAKMKDHQNNTVSSNHSLKIVSSNKDQSTLCKENPPIKKIDDSKTVFCKSPEIYSSLMFTLVSNGNHSSFDDNISSSSNIPTKNIQQLLHPHWKRVPHKSYFGWTNNHENVFNELQIKVQEDKILTAYYRSAEEYAEETKRIEKKTNVKCLKGPVVYNVDDILELIHKTHALSLKNCELKQMKSFKLYSYDADSDEVDN